MTIISDWTALKSSSNECFQWMYYCLIRYLDLIWSSKNSRFIIYSTRKNPLNNSCVLIYWNVVVDFTWLLTFLDASKFIWAIMKPWFWKILPFLQLLGNLVTTSFRFQNYATKAQSKKKKKRWNICTMCNVLGWFMYVLTTSFLFLK